MQLQTHPKLLNMMLTTVRISLEPPGVESLEKGDDVDGKGM